VTRYYDNEILLNINMKCWNLAFNAQGLKVIIIVIQIGVVKIFVTVTETFKKKKRQVQFTTKIMVFCVSTPLDANTYFL
jgi:hypothetical protein